jgi:uncharacterized membrane protein YfcA
MIEIAGFVVLGLATGVLASTLGVGGGIIFVPSLVVFFSFEQHIAQGTSLAVILPTAIVGAYLHSRRGRVDWRVAILIGGGGIAGGFLGAWGALAIDPDLLRRLFAGLLVVVAIRMVSSSPPRR